MSPVNELVRVTPEQSAVIQVMNYTERANQLVIENASDAQHVSNLNRDLGIRIDQVKAVHAELLAPAKLIKETADKYCKPALDDMEAARTIQRNILRVWDEKERARVAEETRIQEEEARKVRQEAERKAAIELQTANAKAAVLRQQAADAAERERLALESGNAAAAKIAAADRAKAESKENAVIETSNAKAANIAIEAAARTSAMPQVQQAAKIEGMSVRTNWKSKLAPGVDADQAKMLLIAAAASTNPEFSAFFKIDTGAIDKLAKSLKNQMRVPGYVAFNDPIVAGARK